MVLSSGFNANHEELSLCLLYVYIHVPCLSCLHSGLRLLIYFLFDFIWQKFVLWYECSVLSTFQVCFFTVTVHSIHQLAWSSYGETTLWFVEDAMEFFALYQIKSCLNYHFLEIYTWVERNKMKGLVDPEKGRLFSKTKCEMWGAAWKTLTVHIQRTM